MQAGGSAKHRVIFRFDIMAWGMRGWVGRAFRIARSAHRIGRAFFAQSIALALCLACLAASEGAAKPFRRVLLVYENESTLPAVMEVPEGLRQRLEELSP